jgi:hypothetical protein
MLQTYMTHVVGNTTTFGPELQDDPCCRCGAESVVNICPGDGRLHHHGRVHTKNGGLEAVCSKCIEDVRKEWNKK